ncbi:DUF427 domain-containing protein [Curtobacterium sp. ISL-83]|uniref:DUF427 domain-containing protein n=1 Tax=Curtobacterium sp. ISL-83 TaxID=2819145 RepID=UPI001BED3944|nr:DUF427 domain-containing protein [Curtobacterium sp. ISL-83]MBT2502885.1 DUF427 domain-containing protein [Curtobacterium sp. ISL-83]
MKDITATARIGHTVIARTTHGRLVEGNAYFPEADVLTDALSSSALTTLCPWKGVARYRHVTLNGVTVKNAAWTYPLPLPLAWFIRNKIAFEPNTGVTVTGS